MTEPQFNYPTVNDGILEHDVFLFQEKGKDFSYQHNSRGMQDFFAGLYDLREVAQRNKVTGLLMLAAAIRGTEAVAWIEHTSNWDGFACFTTKDAKQWTTTWADFHLVYNDSLLDPLDPQGELFAVDSEEFFESIKLRLDGGYLPDDDEDPEWQDGKVVDLDLHDLITVHLWFDT